jgi:hypothetical protein
MDQDDVGLALGNRFQSGVHRSLPSRPAKDRRQNIEVSCLLAVEIEIIASYNRLYETDLRVFYEHYKRATKQAFAAKRAELLGHIAANPRPCSRRHDNGCNIRHLLDAPDFAASLACYVRRGNVSVSYMIFQHKQFLQCNTCVACQNG